MASGHDRSRPDNTLTGVGLRVGLVRARWNPTIVDRLANGARAALKDLGVRHLVEVAVPGAFEVPFGCQTVLSSGSVDALVAVGAVIRGETTHYDIVAGECCRGVMSVQLASKVPIGLGVLTVENAEQALARSEDPPGHNVGAEAAKVAVEMARLAQKHSPTP